MRSFSAGYFCAWGIFVVALINFSFPRTGAAEKQTRVRISDDSIVATSGDGSSSITIKATDNGVKLSISSGRRQIILEAKGDDAIISSNSSKGQWEFLVTKEGTFLLVDGKEKTIPKAR